jgi:hypothetical protein
MRYLLIVVGFLFVYLPIGYHWAKVCERIIQNNEKSFWRFLFFPLNTVFYLDRAIEYDSDFCVIVALFWPIKAMFNVLTLFATLVVFVGIFVGINVSYLSPVIWVKYLLRKRAAKPVAVCQADLIKEDLKRQKELRRIIAEQEKKLVTAKQELLVIEARNEVGYRESAHFLSAEIKE